MTSYLKYKPGWIQLLAFGTLTFGVFLVAVSVGLWVIAQVFEVPLEDLANGKMDTPALLSASRAAQSVLSLSLFGIPALIFGYLSHERPLQFLGFRSPQPPSMWIYSVLILLAAVPMVVWVSQLNHHLHLPGPLSGVEKAIREAEAKTSGSLKQMLQMRNMGEMLIMVSVLALVPAIVEELFFRSVLQRIFIYVTQRPWTGIVLTAIIFSAIHGQFLGFFPRMFLGILLGAIYWFSGSIWPCILVHFLNNAVQVIAVYKYPDFADREWDVPFTLVATSFLLTAGLVWHLTRISHTRYAEQYDNEEDLKIERKEVR